MNYWIILDRRKVGPMTIDQLRDHGVRPETLVWHEGLPTWTPASQLPELDSLFCDREIVTEVAVSPEPEATPLAAADRSPKPQPAGEPAGSKVPPMPPSYLAWSIVAMIFCCLIPAVISLIYSSQVSAKYYAGDFSGAEKYSSRAEIWLIVSITFGLVALPFWLLTVMF